MINARRISRTSFLLPRSEIISIDIAVYARACMIIYIYIYKDRLVMCKVPRERGFTSLTNTNVRGARRRNN